MEHQEYIEAKGPLSYWISRPWLKGKQAVDSKQNLQLVLDWRTYKPKMHRPGHPDPAPDEGNYFFDVYCDHNELGHASNLRVLITHEVEASLTFIEMQLTVQIGWCCPEKYFSQLETAACR
jgi:hypothetical protein